jgi:hypothetical protein
MSNQNNEATQWYSNGSTIREIQSMNEEEMNGILLKLSTERTWIALLRYFQMRFQVLQAGLLTVDPSKSPTEIARIQGYLNGLTDLPNAMTNLVDEAREKNESTIATSVPS